MRQIYIFTAGNKAARKHLEDSILNSVSFSVLEGSLPENEVGLLKFLNNGGSGFYAWGAVPGINNIPTWDSMRPGDLVFTVFQNQYHYFSVVIDKLRSKEVAEKIWGTDDAGRTWEYMYFLSPPQKVEAKVHSAPLGELLHKAYRGFVKISQEKVQRIIKNYGGLDRFVEKEFHAELPPTQTQRSLAKLAGEVDQEGGFNPHSEFDGREKILRAVVSRQGQPKFRKKLLMAYEERCAVTGCDIPAVLEAAHIKPYDGSNSNAVQNGLLLRADIHTLFDLGYLKIDGAGVIHIHDELLESSYSDFHGKVIRFPISPKDAPNVDALVMKFNMESAS